MDTDYIGDALTEESLQRSREQAVKDARTAFFQKQPTPPAVQAIQFRLYSAHDLLNMPPERWLVRNVIPAEGAIALYGASASGKSFLALDLSAAIASGKDWFGYRVAAAPVLFVALEGAVGMRKRVAAWEHHNRRPLPDCLHFVLDAPDVRKLTDVSQIIETAQKAGGVGLLVIDTLSRAAPGAEENSSKDMGEIIANLKILQDSLGCAVLVVHHTGKDATKGLRGHSSLFAALDAAIEVKRDGCCRSWALAKSKDDADGAQHPFALKDVDLGEDADGESVTSCVVVCDEGKAGVASVKFPRGSNQRIAKEALAQPFRDSRDFNKGDAPFGRPCLNVTTAIEIVARCLVCDQKRRKERAAYAINGLVANGIYGSKDDWIWCK
ncbi:helicase RepA family protein [Paraburkholderia denitrificans]|uniref:Helicase RepA family protein n=1 Tax=Paraburkholderia denitrificans TaxID=694025 RepID=A0ABW0J5Y6_9BURK